MGDASRIPDARYQALVVAARGLCCLCHEHPIQEVHHIQYQRDRGGHEEENLIGLCASCHGKVHARATSPSMLLEAKNRWLERSHEILARILRSDLSSSDKIDALVEGFEALGDPLEFERFRDRLGRLLNDETLFGGAARIRRHEVTKVVSAEADCWTYESMRLSPLHDTDHRTMHVRGDGPTSLAHVGFKAWFQHAGEERECDVRIVRDDPTFKSFRINFGEYVPAGDWVNLRWEYFWRQTWNLHHDVYSYDILTWLDELIYDFTLPHGMEIRQVSTALIDLFGREWPGLGTHLNDGRRFRWTVRRPPQFCSALVRYEAGHAGT